MASIYIQKIVTKWTKISRGGTDAGLRNKVPEKLPLEVADTDGAVLLQEIIYNEGGFTNPTFNKIRKLNQNQVIEERFDFQRTDSDLTVEFWNEDQIKKKLGILNFNSWCQIKTNRRFPMEHTTGYYKIVFNIFYGDLSKIESIMSSKEAEFEKDYQTLLK
jgi:hypothetical protein